MSAMSQQLQSDLLGVGTTDPPQHRLPLRKLEILAVDADETQPELKTTSRVDHWTQVKSKLLVKRKYSICGTWRCTSIPPKQRHGREQDATQLASSGLIPTKAATKPHVTARVWCVRSCATKRFNRSSRQHLHWILYESYSVLRVRKMFFELKTLS